MAPVGRYNWPSGGGAAYGLDGIQDQSSVGSTSLFAADDNPFTTSSSSNSNSDSSSTSSGFDFMTPHNALVAKASDIIGSAKDHSTLPSFQLVYGALKWISLVGVWRRLPQDIRVDFRGELLGVTLSQGSLIGEVGRAPMCFSCASLSSSCPFLEPKARLTCSAAFARPP